MDKSIEEMKSEYLTLIREIGYMVICPSCAQKFFQALEFKTFEYKGQRYQLEEDNSLEKTCGIWGCYDNAGYILKIVPKENEIIDIRARYAFVGVANIPRIRPIEIELYRPIPDKPGYVEVVGRKTKKEVFNELEKRLKAQGFYPDEYFSSRDYSNEGDKPFPEFRWISCYAVTGDSEGHYIHIDVIPYDENLERNIIFLGKSFMGMDYAFEIAKACAKHLGA